MPDVVGGQEFKQQVKGYAVKTTISTDRSLAQRMDGENYVFSGVVQGPRWSMVWEMKTDSRQTPLSFLRTVEFLDGPIAAMTLAPPFVPGNLHLEKFAELGSAAPSWFGTGLRTWSLPYHSDEALEAMSAFPAVNSKTFIESLGKSQTP